MGEKDVIDLIENHRELIQNLDSQSSEVQNYLFFLKFVNLIRECFTEEDDITSRFNLSELYELYTADLIVEELFNRTRKLNSFDDLIEELRNNVFIFTDVEKEYLILKSAIQCLLKKWAKAIANQDNMIGNWLSI